MLLQRLVASHVMTEDDLLDLYESMKRDGDEELGDMGRDLSRCLGSINASLGPAFGLEVRTVALSESVVPPSSFGAGGAAAGSSPDDDEEENGGGTNGRRVVRYHSVVNKLSDAVSKSSAHHGPYARNPHELELLKLVLERIVERHLEDLEGAAEDAEDDDGGGTSSSSSGPAAAAAAGCDAGLRRMECINLRTELKGAHKGKVGVREAERALSAFVAEGWLIASHKPKSEAVTPSPEEQEEGEGTQGEGEDGTPSPSSSGRRRKRSKRSIDGLGVMDVDDEDDSKSSRGNYLMIGPRTYMELPDALTDFGLGRERMPQFILHGSG